MHFAAIVKIYAFNDCVGLKDTAMEEAMMKPVVRAQVTHAPGDIGRSPLTGVIVTAALAITFWYGLVWLAERLIG